MNKLISKGYEELGVLARFRQEPLASMGNIRAQFLQVKVPDFRWRYHKGSQDHRITVCQFSTLSSSSVWRKATENNQPEFSHEML